MKLEHETVSSLFVRLRVDGTHPLGTNIFPQTHSFWTKSWLRIVNLSVIVSLLEFFEQILNSSCNVTSLTVVCNIKRMLSCSSEYSVLETLSLKIFCVIRILVSVSIIYTHKFFGLGRERCMPG